MLMLSSTNTSTYYEHARIYAAEVLDEACHSLPFALQTIVSFSPQIKMINLGKPMQEDEILAWQKLSIHSVYDQLKTFTR